jgi:hypothetical protein
MQVPNHVQEHIETIAKHEQEFLARRSPAERLGDLTAAIVGNLGFVAAHIFLFVFWILVNTLHFPQIPHFDPMPFSLLGTVVAMEAILLASLILMRQARLARRADEREHLMQNVNFLFRLRQPRNNRGNFIEYLVPALHLTAIFRALHGFISNEGEFRLAVSEILKDGHVVRTVDGLMFYS